MIFSEACHFIMAGFFLYYLSGQRDDFRAYNFKIGALSYFSNLADGNKGELWFIIGRF